MTARKNFNGECVAVALLFVVAGCLCSATSALGQIKNSSSKSEPYRSSMFEGAGKKVTTYTNYANGDESKEERYVDPRGKIDLRVFTAIKPTGESTQQREEYDRNERLQSKRTMAFDNSGKAIWYQYEKYQEGVLKEGFILEYDEKLGPRPVKEYNPATERYELPSQELVKQWSQQSYESYPEAKKSDAAKTKGPTNTKQSRGNNEEVNEAWWQYFTADKEGLANLKLAILDCDRELSKAVQKWLDAVQAASEQNRKAVKARNAVRPANYRARVAKEAAANAKPEEKEAKEKAAAKAQEEAEAAQKAAETESKKEIDANKVLSEAEKNVDPNVRKMVKEATEKQIEKEKQERAEEKPTKTPQKTKQQERADDRANTKGPPPCPPKTAKGGGGKVAVDACLVGTWRSESVADKPGLAGKRGGSGIVMTIKGDGTITMDYNAMQALEAQAGGIGEKNWWKGTASGRISTTNGVASIISVENSDVSRKFTDPNGRTITNAIGKLGPAALGTNPQDNSYKCDQTSLVRTTPTQIVTFKREKK